MIFLAFFVATSIFYANWNIHWFQSLANEEFRLKRLDFDFIRANWLLETMCRWKDEYQGSDIPLDLINKLATHLFEDEKIDKPPQHPYESLGAALINNAKKVTVGSNGVNAEFGQKEINNLK